MTRNCRITRSNPPRTAELKGAGRQPAYSSQSRTTGSNSPSRTPSHAADSDSYIARTASTDASYVPRTIREVRIVRKREAYTR